MQGKVTRTFSSYSQRLLRAPCMVELPSAVLALEVSAAPSKALAGQQQLGLELGAGLSGEESTGPRARHVLPC